MMKTHLFYFSATGNSLAIARDLARELGDTRIFSIPRELDGEIDLSADRIGLIFPMYYGGIPNIVKRFIGKLPPPRGRYVFAVNSGMDYPLGSLDLARRLLKEQGWELAAGYHIPMPSNHIVRMDAWPKEKQERFFREAKKKIGEIAKRIAAGERKIEKGSFLTTWLLSGMMHNFFARRFAARDKQFWTNEKCTSCGTCEKVCPVNNIELREGKPVWLGRCEQCMACIQWCPESAIQWGDKTAARTRYRNPEVKLGDFINK